MMVKHAERQREWTGGDDNKRHSDVIVRERVRFGLRRYWASETIARRNVAAIAPDRIQTRCRDDGDVRAIRENMRVVGVGRVSRTS
jgi:hypothetical protein